MPNYLKQVERIMEEANARQDAVIAEVRRTLLIPFCDRKGWRFTAGMGSWSFDFSKPVNFADSLGGWDQEECKRLIPKQLLEFLQTDATTCNNDLGSLMEDYTPSNYKPKG
jgi:hypothetical protein